jgi:LacI family transcriptional regulator
MKRVNFQDIATAAGVSKTTVFRAFHGRGINAETRKKILAVAEKLGYRANPLVQAWMTQVRSSRPRAYQGRERWPTFRPIFPNLECLNRGRC